MLISQIHLPNRQAILQISIVQYFRDVIHGMQVLDEQKPRAFESKFEASSNVTKITPKILIN